MKPPVLVLTLWFACTAASAHAQDVVPPLTRVDVWAGIGWHHARLAEDGEYDDWYHQSASGNVSAGWYWTNHLKTDIDVATTSRGRIYVYSPVFIAGQGTTRYGWIRHGTRTLGLTQQYQFFENAWFHPYAGVGLDLVRAREEEHIEPVFIFDRVTQRSRVLEPARDESSTRLLVRPAAALGFKAYMSRRAYFRTDARIGVSRQIEDVVVRFGFGVDF